MIYPVVTAGHVAGDFDEAGSVDVVDCACAVICSTRRLDRQKKAKMARWRRGEVVLA